MSEPNTPDSKWGKEMVQNWIGVQNAMFSLLMAMLGGKDCTELYDSFGPAAWVPKTAFIVFVCFTQISVVNTVTAVFIKCAFMKFEQDREFLVQQETQEEREYLLSVKEVFMELDKDGDGVVSLNELVQQLKTPEVAAAFTRLGVSPAAVQRVFYLMDEDHNDTITPKEFMRGFLRLRGHAKTLDLELLRQDVRLAVKMLFDMEANLKKQLKLWHMFRNGEQVPI